MLVVSDKRSNQFKAVWVQTISTLHFCYSSTAFSRMPRLVNNPSKIVKSNTSNDSVRSYLLEIGRYQLLTHEQEIEYSKQVKQMVSLLKRKNLLTEKLNREPTTVEWVAHIQLPEIEVNQILKQGKRAKQKMIEANLRLVVVIAKKYQNRGLELLDLIQEGNRGLIKGVERFDPTRNCRFSTCAYWWIRQAISRAVLEQGRTVRLPIHISESLNKIKKAQRELSQKLGRTPSILELSLKLDLTQNQLREFLNYAQKPISLDLKIGESRDTDLSDLVETFAVSHDDAVSENVTQNLEILLAELKPMQREVLSLRFGLVDEREHTQAQISERFGFSKQYVSLMQKKALNQLKNHEHIQTISEKY